MEGNQEKRGIVKRTCNFIANHVGEIVISTVGIIAGCCMIKTTKDTNQKQSKIVDMELKEHEERMQLYEKAKYSDNTQVNINI